MIRASLAVALIPLLLASLIAGCHSPNPATQDRTSLPAQSSKGGGLVRDTESINTETRTNAAELDPLVLPSSGRIHSVNPGLQFVVVDYTLGGIPPMQSLVTVYRENQKVGQLRLTGPERNGFVAADIVEGVLQPDDEVRIH